MSDDKNGVYPEMVIGVDQLAQWQRTGAPPSPLGSKVSATLRDVLAWRARSEDSKGFVAALSHAFTPKVENGVTRWLWTPRSYAVQADLGEVTGAQASLYSRAKAAIDHAIPLLEGLHPLDPAADEDDADAVRALIISLLRELVAELGAVGGPRPPRVDGLFTTLIGEDNQPGPYHLPEGALLKVLGSELGLDELSVNTVEDEQNLTNFFIVVDHIKALRGSWNAFIGTLATDPFFGTQLILLSRALASIVESVHQAIFVMDSVFLSSADRQLIRLPSDKGSRSLTITELLSWVERFAAEEAPQIIREAGRRGVLSFTPTLRTLHDYVLRTRSIVGSTAFMQRRVQHSFEELAGYLKEALDLAVKVEAKGPLSIDEVRTVQSVEGTDSVSLVARVNNAEAVKSVKLVRRR